MASKYDLFWQGFAPRLGKLLAESLRSGQSQTLDVREIRSRGERGSWYGRVEVQGTQIVGGAEEAHSKALGNVLRTLEAARAHPEARIRATISLSCKLRLEVLSSKTTWLPSIPPTSPSQVRPAAPLSPSATIASSPAPCLEAARAIHQLAWSLPRYRHPIPFDQLPRDGIYLQFEDGELTPGGPRLVRVGIHKAKTLQQRVAHHYGSSRSSSALRRHLGRAILMRAGASAHEVDAWSNSDVPIPTVERQVSDYLERHFGLACMAVSDPVERGQLEGWLIGVLSAWPVGSPSSAWLGHHAGGAIAQSGLWNVQHVLRMGTPVDLAPLTRLRQLAGLVSQAGRAKTLVLIPCSEGKREPVRPAVSAGSARFVLNDLPGTLSRLAAGREGLRATVRWESPCHAALDYYDGYLYQVPGLREAIGEARPSGAVEVAILSGAYGLVYPEEPIHDYENRLNVAYWRKHGLPEAIAELVERSGAKRVYGFFAATAPYRQIVGLVDWRGLGRRCGLEEVRTFSPRWDGQGYAVREVSETLGEGILAFLEGGLRPEAVLQAPLRLRFEMTRLL